MYDYPTLKDKLTKRTAKELYCSEEALSSEQKSYINSMAFELSGLYAELQKSNEYIAERLREKLQPETINRPLPEHTIIRITPEKATVKLSHEESFDYKTGNENLPPIYFSPLYPTKVFKGDIKFKIGNFGVFEKEEKKDFGFEPSVHISQCWLGLELDARIKSLDGLSFYFPKDESINEQEELMKLVKVEINSQTVETSLGIRKPEEDIPIDFYETLWMRNQVEKPIYEFYKKRFLTIDDAEKKLSVDSLKSKFPLSPDNTETSELEGGLIWVRIDCPFEITESFQKGIQINVVPVLNRKFIKHDDIVLDEIVKMVPLTRRDENNSQVKEQFLGIDRIYTAFDTLKPCMTSDFENSPTGTYGLKYGRPEIAPFDNALKSSYGMLDLLAKDKELDLMHQIFKVENRNDLLTPLTEIQRHLHTLRNRLSERAIEKPYYFVFLKSDGSRENVFLHYWVTQGVKIEEVFFGGKWTAGLFKIDILN